MPDIQFASEYSQELQTEAAASRKCIERVPESLYKWKPHEKSMEMGYLVLLVAEIPLWIAWIIEKGEIDFATYPRYQTTTADAMVQHFDKNLAAARKALEGVTNEQLKDSFALKNQGQLLFSSSKKDNVSSSINHWVHHRGQLTVYMRLNDIAVPSIYGPSADEKTF